MNVSAPATATTRVGEEGAAARAVCADGTVADGSARPVDRVPGADRPPIPPRDARRTPLLLRDDSRIAPIAWFGIAWALLLGAWELGGASGLLNPKILPPPSETIPYLLGGGASIGFGTQRTGLFEAAMITLGRVCLGFGAGLVCALTLGALIVEFRPLRRLVMPLVQTIAPVSPVAWIPFAIVLVGIGAPAAVFVVFMAIFGSMTLASVAAFDGVPREYLKVAQNLATPRRRVWLSVILPAAAPDILTVARMSFFGAWMAVLAGEMAGINSGLGYLIIMGQQLYNMRLVMVGIVCIGLIGLLVDRLLLALQRRVVWWIRP